MSIDEVRAGLCVVINCRDERLMEELVRGGSLLVQGLTPVTTIVEEAKRALREKNLYGQITVEKNELTNLAYVDNLANLVIVEDWNEVLTSEKLSVEEVLRITCPKGVVVIGRRDGANRDELESKLREAGITNFSWIEENGIWAKVVKGRPMEMDEWRQHFRSYDRNRVSQDTLVKPPSSLRWIAGPSWPRGHRKASTLAMVSANGRNFYYTVNSASNMNLPPQQPLERDRWYLIARDAYNGLLLWEKRWEYGSWWQGPYVHHRGPIALAADDTFVYTAIRRNHLVILDAATGETQFTYQLTSMPEEIFLIGEIVLVKTEDEICRVVRGSNHTFEWRVSIGEEAEAVASEQNIFILEPPSSLKKLDLSGREIWQREYSGLNLSLHFYAAESLVFTSEGKIVVIASSNGDIRWQSPSYRWKKPALFFVNNLLWSGRRVGEENTRWEAREITSGVVRRTLDEEDRLVGCGRVSATPQYFIFDSNKSINFVDFQRDRSDEFFGFSGHCVIPAVPANGLLYLYPHACGCYFPRRRAIRGFAAMDSTIYSAGARQGGFQWTLRGPAWGSPRDPDFQIKSSDWPTYRSSSRRSGCASTTLTSDLTLLWREKIVEPPNTDNRIKDEWRVAPHFGEILTPPVIAGGIIFVAQIDAHRILALDEGNKGNILWDFVADGRIDSPPTIYEDLCIFGTRGGGVYCLKARTGELVWRFQAAPRPEKIIAYGQVESLWPTSGSVLVERDIVFVFSGRSGRINSGCSLCALDPRTGELYWEKRLANDFITGQTILVSDGQIGRVGDRVAFEFTREGYRNASSNRPFIKAQYGLAQPQWHRLPCSIHNGQSLWSFGRRGEYSRGVHLVVFRESDNTVFSYREIEPQGKLGNWPFLTACEIFSRGGADWRWPVPEPKQIEAMLVADDLLFAAGPENKFNPERGSLWIISTERGQVVEEIPLPAAPVFDGIAAANQRLYLITQDGKISCFGSGVKVEKMTFLKEETKKKEKKETLRPKMAKKFQEAEENDNFPKGFEKWWKWGSLKEKRKSSFPQASPSLSISKTKEEKFENIFLAEQKDFLSYTQIGEIGIKAKKEEKCPRITRQNILEERRRKEREISLPEKMKLGKMKNLSFNILGFIFGFYLIYLIGKKGRKEGKNETKKFLTN